MYWLATCIIELRDARISEGHLRTRASRACSSEEIQGSDNKHQTEIRTCKDASRRSSLSRCVAFNRPGTISGREGAIRCGEERAMAATSWTMVICFSTLAVGARFGIISELKSPENTSEELVGTKRESVAMARFRTAGRACDRSGVRTLIGGG